MKRTAILTLTAALLIPAAAAKADHRYSLELVVSSLAEDVEYFAREAYREASRASRYADGRGYRAMLDLRALDHQARHFRRQVRRYHRDPFHSAHDFEQLRVAFYAAHGSVPVLYGYGYLERDFYALADAMRRLEYAFLDLGYRYRRPLPRLSISIDLGRPYYHHPRGHRIYRKPYGGGFHWFISYDSRHSGHGKKYFKHDKRRHHKYDKRDRHRRHDRDRHFRRDRDDDRDDHRGRGRGRDRHYRRDHDDDRDRERGRRFRGDRDDHRDDDRDRRRRGSAVRTRPPR